MKWVLSQPSSDQHRWLLHDEELQAQFIYHAALQSIRIKAKNNRLFFLELTGLLQKKIQLLSEYGIVVGETWISNLKNGSLIIDEQKYFYHWNNDQLCIYDRKRILVAEISIEFSKGTDKLEQFALLFSIVWVISSNKKSYKPEALLIA